MEYRKLGNTDLDVSVICLGTMTWGEQNTFEEGYEQMDYAVEQGVNFFDTAELYPIPPKPDTQGKTEECIGNWFKSTGKREDIILASKVTGRAPMEWFRGGCTSLDRANSGLLEPSEAAGDRCVSGVRCRVRRTASTDVGCA